MNRNYLPIYFLFLPIFFYGNFLFSDYSKNSPKNYANAADTITYEYGAIKKVEIWKFDHYALLPGKLIGIWPYDYSTFNLRNYRIRLGYNGIFISSKSSYKNALDAGFEINNIIMNAAYNKGTMDYKNIILTCDAGYYYIDEAVNHSCFGYGNKRLYSPEELRNAVDFIHSNRKNSLFISSGYKRCLHLDTLTSIVDKIMYSGYSDWYLSIFPCSDPEIGWGPNIEFAWLPGSYDQRTSWKDMKKRYGSKFSMTWINSFESNEFDDLFSEAKELGLNEVWIYTLDKRDSLQFENISNAAFKYGFLRRFLKKYLYIYECVCKTGCNDFQPENTMLWQLKKEEPTNIIKEE